MEDLGHLCSHQLLDRSGALPGRSPSCLVIGERHSWFGLSKKTD
jgi:hypothetical protein